MAKRQTQERLLEYEQVVEAVDRMIVVIDRQYRYVLANQAFLNYLGLPREQVVGHLVSDVWGEELFLEIKDRLDKTLSGAALRSERRASFPRRGERDVAVFYFPIEGAAGIDRLACIVEDVTELKQAELEREKLLAALQASNEQLRILADRLVAVQEEDRRRLVQEINDEISQSLTSLMAQLEDARSASQNAAEAGESSTASLTPREQEVLQLLVQGQTNREIAGRLAISARTVERYRASIMNRLGLRNSTELIIYAVTHGFHAG